eukprot:4138585-Amphidinium_carterae.1
MTLGHARKRRRVMGAGGQLDSKSSTSRKVMIVSVLCGVGFYYNRLAAAIMFTGKKRAPRQPKERPTPTLDGTYNCDTI